VSTRIQPIRRSSEVYGIEPGDPGRSATLAGVGQRLGTTQGTEFATRTLGATDLDGRRVCLVVPGGIRPWSRSRRRSTGRRAVPTSARTVPVIS
jgi:lactate racemase